ncbi:ABC transporter substrate-binding protein [Thiococcus pfennigii]|uniref:ABC transporter substrate-binding protein n=1 Tax=Thiococcus pfennigii TaxID=1057 RepID=UPI001905DAF5|nr:ABC transporter substrate-binding protein [Thiococcus pfennigii]MBK1730660.1 ABC transporter substrate-binding protein [Thiococcus pfennigii]
MPGFGRCRGGGGRWLAAALAGLALLGCGGEDRASGPPVLAWYVFDEPSGAFAEAARRCAAASHGAYRIALRPLPADADQQREQLVRRLAAGDRAIDLIGMDVIWTAEFAAARWILPWPEETAQRVRAGRIAATVASATYEGRLWAIPFTTNTQLLWYRTDRVAAPPPTWDAMIQTAEALGSDGTIQAQGERYEGLTVFFVSLLASAGGAVLSEDGRSVSLATGPTREALRVMRRLADSPASAPGLASAREDQCRLAFEAGGSSFMVNYTYVWPSARANAPAVAEAMGWARWPGVAPDRPSRVAIGGINLGVAAFSRHPDLARQAAACLAAPPGQRLAAGRGGLPPTLAALYDDPAVRATFPFADLLRATLRDAVQRPQTPLYNDVSLAIGRVLHPPSAIDPARDVERLREALGRALRSEGLL